MSIFVPQVEDGWRCGIISKFVVSVASTAMQSARRYLSEGNYPSAYDAVRPLRDDRTDLRCRREVQDFAIQLLMEQGRFVECLSWTHAEESRQDSVHEWYHGHAASSNIDERRPAAPPQSSTTADGDKGNSQHEFKPRPSCDFLSPLLSVLKQRKEFTTLSPSDVLQRAVIWVGIFHETQGRDAVTVLDVHDDWMMKELAVISGVMVISVLAEVVAALQCKEHSRCPLHWQTLATVFAAVQRLAVPSDNGYGALAAGVVRDYIEQVIVRCLQLRDRPHESSHRSYLQNRVQLDVTLLERHRGGAFGLALQQWSAQEMMQHEEGVTSDVLVEFLTVNIIDALLPLQEHSSVPYCWSAIAQRITSLSSSLQQVTQPTTDVREVLRSLLRALFSGALAVKVSAVFGQPRRGEPAELEAIVS